MIKFCFFNSQPKQSANIYIRGLKLIIIQMHLVVAGALRVRAKVDFFSLLVYGHVASRKLWDFYTP